MIDIPPNSGSIVIYHGRINSGLIVIYHGRIPKQITQITKNPRVWTEIPHWILITFTV